MALLLILAPAVALCQPPDFSGTWKLDQERSSVNVEATLSGLIGGGAPPTLHITQPANGTLVIESQINESHARLYVPGAQTTTRVFLGVVGTITMTTKWKGQTLMSEGTRDSSSEPSIGVEEAFALSANGQTLEVEITVSTDDEKHSSTLRYVRTRDVGPCESWPTPCKDFSRLGR